MVMPAIQRGAAPCVIGERTQLRDAGPWVISPTRDEAVLVGERRCRGARRDTQLREDVAHVTVDGPLAEHELDRDRLVRVARGDQSQHLELALGEAVGLAPPLRGAEL